MLSDSPWQCSFLAVDRYGFLCGNEVAFAAFITVFFEKLEEVATTH